MQSLWVPSMVSPPSIQSLRRCDLSVDGISSVDDLMPRPPRFSGDLDHDIGSSNLLCTEKVLPGRSIINILLEYITDRPWEHLTYKEVVDIVQNHSRNVCVRPIFPKDRCRLVKMALRAAAKKREMISTDVKKIERGVRRHFHDDIIVVVILLGTNVVSSAKGPSLSMVVTVAVIFLDTSSF
ncbi:Protein phosphatase 2C family protein [Raphanus sativus]|nr:Protein phosphatase 2C family protein [Raphanus sativus]